MSTITLELPAEIVDLATTPEGMERARALLIAAFSEEAERIASLRRSSAQLDAGDSLPPEESRARGLAAFHKMIDELKDFAPKGTVFDDSRASYYEDDKGRLPGMDGYGRDDK